MHWTQNKLNPFALHFYLTYLTVIITIKEEQIEQIFFFLYLDPTSTYNFNQTANGIICFS